MKPRNHLEEVYTHNIYNQFYNLPIRDRDYLLMYFSSLDTLIWFIMIHIDIPNRLKGMTNL